MLKYFFLRTCVRNAHACTYVHMCWCVSVCVCVCVCITPHSITLCFKRGVLSHNQKTITQAAYIPFLCTVKKKWEEDLVKASEKTASECCGTYYLPKTNSFQNKYLSKLARATTWESGHVGRYQCIPKI